MGDAVDRDRRRWLHDVSALAQKHDGTRGSLIKSKSRETAFGRSLFWLAGFLRLVGRAVSLGP